MKKEYRLKKKSEIDAVFQKRNQKGNRHIQIYKDVNQELSHFKFALSIGKKYGNAVMRNKIKRQIRYIVHELKDELKHSSLFVIVIKPLAKELTYQELKNNVINLLIKLNIKE